MEVTSGFVQNADPIEVRFRGDNQDAPVPAKAAGYTPNVTDEVVLVRAGSRDGWVIVAKLDTAWPQVTQSGKASGTTNGSGEFTITFPQPFQGAVPVMTLLAQTTTTRIATLSSLSLTSATCVYRDSSTGSPAVSAGYFVHWTATGILAAPD